MALPATRPTGAIPAGAVLSSDQLLEIYYYLRLTRTLEERLVALYRQTKVIGGLFRSLGQEGESVATAYALERGRHKDILSPLIRNLGSLLVMGAQPIEILRQYMAKADSPTHGRELNLHFNDLEKGYLGQISHLGDMIPVMAGIALSFKLPGEARQGRTLHRSEDLSPQRPRRARRSALRAERGAGAVGESERSRRSLRATPARGRPSRRRRLEGHRRPRACGGGSGDGRVCR